MDYTKLPRTIQNPYWGKQDKTQVMCEFNYEGGPIVTAAVSNTREGNPDWKEIMEKWTIAEIDENTDKILNERNSDRQKNRQFELDEAERMKGEALFAAKLEAFEIDLIKNSKDRELKSRIRKSKNLIEVTAFTTALILKEHENK